MARRFDHLSDVEVLLNVVEHGSFSAAAVVLSTTASVLSRAVSRLESRLGAQLLRRTTRSLSLTDAGQRYADEMRAAFARIEQAEQTIRSTTEQLSGKVRMSVPTSYGKQRLPALLAAYARAYPLVALEVDISNRNVDLVAEGFDLAIRSGQLPSSSMVARTLEVSPLCLVAAPDYLEASGPLCGLADLARQRCIAFIRPSTGRVIPWHLRDDGRDIDWVPPAVVTVSTDVMGIVWLAEQGMGIALCPRIFAEDSLAAGRLVEVLPGLGGRTRTFSVIYPAHRGLSAASRALIEMLVANHAHTIVA
jgi:DNA-binding transcriptional LysR family regulator